MPYLPHVFLKLSTKPCVHGITTYPMVGFGLEMVVVTVLAFALLLACMLLFKNTGSKYGIQTYLKGNTTIKQSPHETKGPGPQGQQSGVIFIFQ